MRLPWTACRFVGFVEDARGAARPTRSVKPRMKKPFHRLAGGGVLPGNAAANLPRQTTVAHNMLRLVLADPAPKAVAGRKPDLLPNT